MKTTQEELINDEDNENEEADSDSDDDNDNEECWNEESSSCCNSVNEGIQFNEDYGILISKVCKTVKLFRKSPLKNDTLQNICRTDLGKEIKLILDTKTR